MTQEMRQRLVHLQNVRPDSQAGSIMPLRLLQDSLEQFAIISGGKGA